MFDTHCHLTGDRYKDGIDSVLDRARQAGLSGMIAVAIDLSDALEAQSLAEQHPDVWFTAGVHPSEAGREHDLSSMGTLAHHPRCVAWGEMGLDGHWPDPPMERQCSLLEQQLDVVVNSTQHKLPVVLHSRKAVDDVLGMLVSAGLPGDRCIFHCFTEGPEAVERVLATGAAVSFTGVVTYRNAADVALASDRVPLERLMVETDSPYLTPEPHRGIRPNEPAQVVHIADFLAARRGMSRKEFEAATDATASRIFGLHKTP